MRLGVSGLSVPAVWSCNVTPFCHKPETKEYFALETYWTSKYQNLAIKAFQKSLGLCIFEEKNGYVREIL